MFFPILLFFAGFYILIQGANFLVDGASALARRFNIADIIIGLVIVGIGTSIPEFAVSFLANLTGRGEIGLGTIIGSNTFNILFILGASALVAPLTFKTIWVERDLTWNIVSVFSAAIFALPFGDGVISRGEGALMFVVFCLWLYITIRNSTEAPEGGGRPIKIVTLPLILGLILAGLVGVILGGKWVVDGAAAIARELGVKEGAIGLTLVGIGTSLPEFAVTFVAALRREPGIAVGNIIGSNIFDFLMILGFGALVRPIVFPPGMAADIVVTILSAILLYGFMHLGRQHILRRSHGLIMLILYFWYLAHIIGKL
jgi:cation:H+ antiporter